MYKLALAILVGFVVGFWAGVASAHHIAWYDVIHLGDQGVIVCGDGQSAPSVAFSAYPEGPGFAYECVAVATPTPTPTPIPPTPTPSDHNNAVWHGPAGNTHEHGDEPPSWLPTSGACAGIALAQQAAGRENHVFYKGYDGTTENGVNIYIVNHVAPTLAGRSHGDHDETIIFRDLSGNYSCWQGIGEYAPAGAPETDPIEVFVKPCGGVGPNGPIILVECGLASESWYQEPGAGWCDNTTHVNGVWQDINGNNRGDGTSRHMEISCYAPRLPGPNAVSVAPTLAQDCIVIFSICQFKAVTEFAKDFGSVIGPN